MGFSMGARLILSCLQELAEIHKRSATDSDEKGSPVSGLIDTVVLMGTPYTCNKEVWSKAASVVNNRLVNCYSKNDWMLSLIYRYHRISLTVAGVTPVQVKGVENVDCAEVIKGHEDYPRRVRDVLKKVGLDDGLVNIRETTL